MSSPKRKPQNVFLITRIDPVTGETFIPKNRKQVFANKKNRRKYYYDTYKERLQKEFIIYEGDRISIKRRPFVILMIILFFFIIDYIYNLIGL